MSTMREAFEKWFSDDGEHPQSVQRDSFGNYMMMQANSAWNAWQEAWRVASAQMQGRCVSETEFLLGPSGVCDEIAATIRAIPKE